MNGFGRIGVPALATALASLLLPAQAAIPAGPGADLIPQNLQATPAFRVSGNMVLPNQVVISGFATGANVPLDQIDQVLPIVSEGFASDQPINGSIEPLVQALHSESFRVREQASHQLLCLPPNRLQDITAALAVETDAEAISRLQVAAGHLFLKPRTNVHANAGFLGISTGAAGEQQYVSMLGMKFDDPETLQMDGLQGTVAVRVRELQPGFPAAQELRNGDLIIAIAGRGFSDDMVADLVSTDDVVGDASFAVTSTNDSRRMAANTMFQSRIRALLPGSIVTFTVLRDGKLADVPVQLTAMKSTDGIGLTSLVDVRNKCMADFVASLKTGDRGPSSARAMSARADMR